MSERDDLPAASSYEGQVELVNTLRILRVDGDIWTVRNGNGVRFKVKRLRDEPDQVGWVL